MTEQAPRPGVEGINLPPAIFHGPRDELKRLINAVRDNIGPCNCVVHHHPFYGPCEGHPCDGHKFLGETDDPGRTVEWTIPEQYGARHFATGSLSGKVTRLDRLMFARSMKWQWVLQEMGEPRASWPPQEKLRNPEDFNW